MITTSGATARRPSPSLGYPNGRMRVGLRISHIWHLVFTGRGYHTFRMGYYLLEYALIDDYLARRAAFREAHLALAREAHRRGDLILAGALAEPTDRAVLVWQTDDRATIERFIERDPYVDNGLVTSWTIRPWTVVVGAGQAQALSTPAHVSE